MCIWCGIVNCAYTTSVAVFPLVYIILPKTHSKKYKNSKIISHLIKYFINEIKLVIDEKMLKYFYNNPKVSYYWKWIRQRLKKYTIHLRNNFSCLFTNGGFNIVYKRMKTFKPSLLLTEFNQAEKEVSDSQVQYKKVEMEFTQDAETKNILYVWHFLRFKPHLLLWKNKTFL